MSVSLESRIINMSDIKKLTIFIISLCVISIGVFLFSSNISIPDQGSMSLVDNLNQLLVKNVKAEDIELKGFSIYKVKQKKSLLGIRRINFEILPGYLIEEIIEDNTYRITVSRGNNSQLKEYSININKEITDIEFNPPYIKLWKYDSERNIFVLGLEVKNG